MKDYSEVDLDRIKRFIAEIESQTFTTADVIRKYLGHFQSDQETPASYSFNALFGKILKRKQENLGISERSPGTTVKDDDCHTTTSSLWERSSG